MDGHLSAEEIYPATAFFYRPHTILILIALCGALLHYALYSAGGAQQGFLDQAVRSGQNSYDQNAKMFLSFTDSQQRPSKG